MNNRAFVENNTFFTIFRGCSSYMLYFNMLKENETICGITEINIQKTFWYYILIAQIFLPVSVTERQEVGLQDLSWQQLQSLFVNSKSAFFIVGFEWQTDCQKKIQAYINCIIWILSWWYIKRKRNTTNVKANLDDLLPSSVLSFFRCLPLRFFLDGVLGQSSTSSLKYRNY